jgi:hypothetical protein
MFSAIVSPKGSFFIAYTALGYLSLIIHQGLFVPEMMDGVSSTAHGVLALVNLAAGSWCFLRALHSAWVAGNALHRP